MDAIVVFGDVVRSRRDSVASADWLRALTAELNDTYGDDERLAPFDFTQGDELQGLLPPTADPLAAVLRASLHPDARRMRWVVVAGEVDPGRGPATQRSGPAFLAARERLVEASARRDGLAMACGDERSDRLLDDLAPLLLALLDDLTPAQRRLARLMLVEGLRQSEAADRLGVARATVSVAAERARIRGLVGLRAALLAILREGIEARQGRA